MSATWDDAIDRKCRSCAADYNARIADLEARVAARERVEDTVAREVRALRELEDAVRHDHGSRHTGLACQTCYALDRLDEVRHG
jgi:hypothetical protein